MPHSKHSHHLLHLPAWAPRFYTWLAVALVPWIMVLSYSLPVRHISHNWDTLWVGFDVILFAAVALSAYFGFKRSPWLAFSCVAVATLLLVDAWFDVLSARPGLQTTLAVVMALALELPIAALSMWISVSVGRRLIRG